MFDQKDIKQAIATLKQQFGERLSTSQAIRQQHGHNTTSISNQPPDAVIFAKTTDEVSAILKICNQTNCT